MALNTAMALCLTCSVLGWASQVWFSHAAAPGRSWTEACAARGPLVQGRIRFAFEWGAAKFYTSAVCVVVPWTPPRPVRGTFWLPP